MARKKLPSKVPCFIAGIVYFLPPAGRIDFDYLMHVDSSSFSDEGQIWKPSKKQPSNSFERLAVTIFQTFEAPLFYKPDDTDMQATRDDAFLEFSIKSSSIFIFWA